MTILSRIFELTFCILSYLPLTSRRSPPILAIFTSSCAILFPTWAFLGPTWAFLGPTRAFPLWRVDTSVANLKQDNRNDYLSINCTVATQ